MKPIFIQFCRLLIIPFLLIGCSSSNTEEANVKLKREHFGTLQDGTEIMAYTLTNANGISMKVISFGGIITSLKTPDRDGTLEDIVLGYDNLEGYVTKNPYFGALIGRFGNRIANGQFTLDGQTYDLAKNNGPNHLHGGIKGFDKVVWDIKPVEADNGVAVELSYLSKHLEEGYPGNLSVKVTYTLTNSDELVIDYNATTDQKTIVNLTQHTYFNLSSMKSDVLAHELRINADKFLPVDSTLIPIGDMAEVKGSPFDFRHYKPIGRDIHNDHEQLTFGQGYDHCWVLNNGSERMNFAASAYEPKSGRQVDVYTTEPGIQFYSGNFLDGTIIGKDQNVYAYRTGFCLETQHFPDAPNKPHFPSVVLQAGDVFKSTTKYVFITKF